jgi:hypothetical protein
MLAVELKKPPEECQVVHADAVRPEEGVLETRHPTENI